MYLEITPHFTIDAADQRLLKTSINNHHVRRFFKKEACNVVKITHVLDWLSFCQFRVWLYRHNILDRYHACFEKHLSLEDSYYLWKKIQKSSNMIFEHNCIFPTIMKYCLTQIKSKNFPKTQRYIQRLYSVLSTEHDIATQYEINPRSHRFSWRIVPEPTTSNIIVEI